MRKHNEKPTVKSKSIYFQIGLIVALATALFFIEQTSREITPKQEAYKQKVFKMEETYNLPIVLEKVKQETKLEKKQNSKQLPTQPSEIPDLKMKDIFKSSFNEPDKGEVELIDLIDEPIANVPKSNKPLTMISLSDAPVFPGCEIFNSKNERISCFSEKIKQLINRKFDNGLGAELGLIGQQRIYVNFTINKKGEVVDIKARSAHKALADEARRVTKLLPVMKPGKQNGDVVDVTYSLPILLNIQPQ